MRTISAQAITDTVARLCIEANTRLPKDVEAALAKARAEEPWPLAKNTLDLLWSNLSAAKEENLPICQDTGMACVFVELGTDVHIDGHFEEAIHEGVRRGYTDGYLRKSIVADPLRRGNTGDNTPAAITVHLVDGDGCTITVAPKGFGSENMSRIQMLKPADGVEGFKKFVIETVKLAGSNPCPPIVLGVGVWRTHLPFYYPISYTFFPDTGKSFLLTQVLVDKGTYFFITPSIFMAMSQPAFYQQTRFLCQCGTAGHRR